MKTRKTKKASGPASLLALISRLESAHEHELASILTGVRQWEWPRTDLQSWVDVLNRFDTILEAACTDYALRSIQINPFTPKTKQLVLAILQFTQLLLENATNRKIFNSYDRINDLLLTCDLDVLEATLRLALRPAQQYRRTDAVAEERLFLLAQAWSSRDHGVSLVDVAGEQATLPTAPKAVAFKFYRKDMPEGEGMATVSLSDLNNTEAAARSDVDLMMDLAEANQVPATVRLGLLQKIRIVRAMVHVKQRRQLLVIHCLVLAVLSALANDQRLQAKLFSYEPDLVPRIAELLHTDRKVPIELREVALHALEALGKSRSKSSEVLAAMGVSVNHGTLMQTLRMAVAAITGDDSTTQVTRGFVDALFGLMQSLQSHHQHVGASLVGAGVVPLLVDLIKRTPLSDLPSATRAVGYLESASYAFSAAATALFGAEGIPTYINRLKDVVEADAAAGQSPAASSSTSNGTLPQTHAVFLKAILRSLVRMMSTNSNADALRNLIDSTLPETIRSIMQHRKVFGPQIYALALNVMMTFVHNEPTSLAILQEKGLPDIFYASIREPLDASIDVISAIPNTIGALCLNEAGLTRFKAMSNEVFTHLLAALTQEPHMQVLLERENASMFGATIDEIIRHHPSLKEGIFQVVTDIMRQALEQVDGYEPPVAPARIVAINSAEEPPKQPEGKPVNLAVTRLEVLAKFLEGICQNQSHSKEIAKSSILESLTAMVASKGVAGAFAEHSSSFKAITALFKIISDSANVACLMTLIKRTRVVLAGLKDLQQGETGGPKLAAILAPDSPQAVQDANETLTRLQQARNLLLLFQGIVPHITFTQSRGVISSALSCLSGSAGTEAGSTTSILQELGDLTRVCAWEQTRLQQRALQKQPDGAAQLSSPTLLDGTLAKAAREAASRGNTPAPEIAPPTDNVKARDHNVDLLRPILRSLCSSFRTTFTAIIARSPPRRLPDANYRTEARTFSTVAAKILVADLSWQSDASSDDLAYAVIVLNNVREIIVQERWATNVSATLAVAFQRQGGLDRILALYTRFASLCAESLAAAEGQRAEHIMATLQGEENATARLRLLQAVSGLRVLLELINKLVSKRIIPDAAVQNSNKAGDKIPGDVSPTAYFVTVRSQLLPALVETWKAPFLESLPPTNVRLVCRTLLSVIEGDGEQEAQWASRSAPSGMGALSGMLGMPGARAQPFQLDEARVRSVMDMGFPRGAAAHALRRYHNNANAAAEYLLQHPEVVAIHANAPEPEARPESPDVRDPVPAGATVNAGTAAAAAAPTGGDAEMTDAAAEQRDAAAAAEAARAEAEALEQSRKSLSEHRTSVKEGFLARAIELLGTFDQLIFEIRDACRSAAFKDQSGLELALRALSGHASADILSETLEPRIAAEMRLLALLATDSASGKGKEMEERVAAIAAALLPFLRACDESPKEGAHLPTWLGSLLLSLSGLLSFVDSLKASVSSLAAKDLDSDAAYADLVRGPSLDSERSIAFNVCIKVLRSEPRNDDTLSAVLRTTALLTRRADFAHRFVLCGAVPQLMRHTMESQAKGMQETAVMVLRHLVEAEQLVAVMRTEIVSMLKRPRAELESTIVSVANSLKYAALRDPVAFLRALPQAGKILNFDLEPDADHIGSLRVTAAQDTAASAPQAAPSDDVGSLIEHLVATVQASVREAIVASAAKSESASIDGAAMVVESTSADPASMPAPEPSSTAPASATPTKAAATAPRSPSEAAKAMLKARFALSCLVELLHSYMACKVAFIRHAGKSPERIKDGAALLDFVLSDILCIDQVLEPSSTAQSEAKEIRMSEWAALLVAALSSDLTIEGENGDEMGAVHGQVVDALSRAFKGTIDLPVPASKRYERLGLVSDLCMRLLSTGPADPRRPQRPRDDSQLSIAKVMIDKGLPSVLISAIAEVDLNYPSVETLVERILKPMQQLSKLVTKVGPIKQADESSAQPGAASAAAQDAARAASPQSHSSMSEDEDRNSNAEDLGEEEDDPYRTSALGLYEGELEPGGMQQEVYDPEEDFDDPDEGMDMLDDIAAPGGMVPSDMSEDEGEVEQGFAESDSEDETMSDHSHDDIDGPPAVADGDMRDGLDHDEDDEGDEVMFDDDNDDVSDHLHAGGHPDWNDHGHDYVLGPGADELADELADQLDSMRADEEQAGEPDDEDDEPVGDEEPLGGDGESEGGTDSEGEPLDDIDAEEQERVEEAMAAAANEFPPLNMRGQDPVVALDFFDDHLGNSRRLTAGADAAEPRFIGGNNGFTGPREGLRDVGLPSSLVDPDSASRAAPARLPGGRQSFLPPPRRGLDDMLGQGTFALLEQFMQGLQGHGGQGLTGLFGGLAGMPGAEIIIETGDGQLRGTARLGGPPGHRHHHHHHHHHHHSHRAGEDGAVASTEPAFPPVFAPASTALRWDQEARLHQSPLSLQERTRSLAELILIALRPQARLAQKAKREAAEAEEKARIEAAEKEAAQKVKEAEEKAAAQEAADPVAAGAPVAAASGGATAGDAADEQEEGQDAMEGVSTSAADDPVATVIALAHALGGTTPAPISRAPTTTAAAATAPAAVAEAESPIAGGSNAAAAEPSARVTIEIHGEMVDITDTGIDATFLEALPDDMREEIVNQHYRDSRPAAANPATPAVPSSISNEFLDALPPAIRAEVLQQERMEQARQRTRDAAQAGRAAGGNGAAAGGAAAGGAGGNAAAQAEEMDAASFLATINDPLLRESVLMEHVDQGGDAFFDSLPPGLAAEVEALRNRLGDDQLLNMPMPGRPRRPFRVGNEANGAGQRDGEASNAAKNVVREPIQLVDKTGIANLIRLLFLPQSVQQSVLHNILVNLCAHAKTRIELVSLLLGILQDGTRDVQAIERTYTQVSKSASKASATPKLAAKRGQTLGDALGESTPNLVAQRCLDALTQIVSTNPEAPVYFLEEQDAATLAAKKPVSAKKAKGKEKERSNSLPLSILLDLLERPSVLATQSLMEALTSLLAAVTRPLTELGKPTAQTQPDTAIPAAVAPSDGNVPAADAMQIEAATPAQTAAPATSSAPVTSSAKRVLAKPPVIPAATLRMIVNILDGECSSRTFSHTLTALQHVSNLEGAKETLSGELVTRAEQYGRVIQDELRALSASLAKATKQADIPSEIMGKVAPSTANQAKLLRVLKTLDYLHLKVAKTANGGAAANGSKSPTSEEETKLNEIYLGLDFSGLWRLVGECLAAVEDKPDLVYMATVLLPLIEALLVIAKSLGTLATRPVREAFSPIVERNAASPKELLENTFLAFTRRHRKLLNVLVRNNPSLVSGSFSVLVKAPGVLDFEAKRNYFNGQLHRRTDRRQYGTIPLNLRRAYLFEDTFQALNRRTAAEIKHGRISIRFYNEEGVDAGGLTRDWATQLVKRIFNPDYALFSPSSSDALVWQPNPQSYVNPDHLAFFAFVGRIIAKFVYDGRLLDAFFCRSFYKHLLGTPVSVADLESVDPDSFRSLTWMLENDIEGVLDLTFSVETDAFGVETTVDLKPGGRDVAVTNANKREYVELVATHRLTLSIAEQINAFVTGFTEIIPRELISVFSPQELQLLISGLPDIDADEWRAATDYAGGLTAASPSVTWFWRAVRSFSQEERAKLLQFATGSSRVPLEGFGALQGSSGVTRFTVVGAHTTDALPSAHTCFNQLDLPNYSSYESLREKLILAISETEGFGFA